MPIERGSKREERSAMVVLEIYSFKVNISALCLCYVQSTSFIYIFIFYFLIDGIIENWQRTKYVQSLQMYNVTWKLNVCGIHSHEY